MDNPMVDNELSGKINDIIKEYTDAIEAAQDRIAVEIADRKLYEKQMDIVKEVTGYRYPNEVPREKWSNYNNIKRNYIRLFNNDQLAQIKLNRLRELEPSPLMLTPDQVNSGHGGKRKSLYKRNRNKSRKCKSRKNRKKTNRRRG
jgi:hypothetical protein